MSQLKTLYTQLVEHRHAELEEWRWEESYKALLADVAVVRDALASAPSIGAAVAAAASHLHQPASEQPWPDFARRLLYERSNGIAARGMSVLTDENFLRFLETPEFIAALVAMIQQPDRERFRAFDQAWNAALLPGSRRSPLLVRRTLAACTTDVTSTVHEWDFNTVYFWLEGEGLLDETEEPADDWHGRNLRVMRTLRRVFAEELAAKTTNEVLLSIFVWQLVGEIANPFTLKKQVIKYGAPGTGKTFSADQEARLAFRRWEAKHGAHGSPPTYEACSETVQFHPSYGYEDFIEGLRPVPDGTGGVALRLCNGIFKEFCRRAGAWELDVHAIPEARPEQAAGWEELTVGALRPHFDGPLSHERWAAIRALPDDARVAGAVPPFFFLIDEINRAELSRVFGELMLCLEYRGTGRTVSTQYAALDTAGNALLTVEGRARFFIPHNVYLLGTMNTIDRSVESFDLALRRRFRWERVWPNLAVLRYHLQQRDAKAGSVWEGLTDHLESLNQRIREATGLGRDYEIGHAYLMNLRYPPRLTESEVRKRVWADALAPLLEEYLRGSDGADDRVAEFATAFGAA